VTDSDLNLATSDLLAVSRSPFPPVEGAIDATVRPLERTVNTCPLATSRKTLENCRFAVAAEIVFTSCKSRLDHYICQITRIPPSFY
jgi:hypothetical protein